MQGWEGAQHQTWQPKEVLKSQSMRQLRMHMGVSDGVMPAKEVKGAQAFV